MTLSLRRLRCGECDRIHHELPDLLVPYKRFDAESIEMVVSGSKNHDVPADNSTLFRWINWFSSFIYYWVGCLNSIALLFHQDTTPVNLTSTGSLTGLQRIGRMVGDAPKWLQRMTRSIVNSNLWVHTRSAFLSE
jgi:hypothetical protein